MSFILYVVVLVVSVSSVMMGLDWLSTPPPPLPKSVQTVSAPAKPVAKTAAAAKSESKQAETKQAETKQAASQQTVGRASSPAVADAGRDKSTSSKTDAATATDAASQRDVAATSETAGSAPANAAADALADAADNKTDAMANASDVNAAATAAAAPRCDVQACAAHYRSFRESDCTYQPYDGPRRLCTVGNPPKQASDTATDVQTSDARQPAASSSCHYDACAAAYRSFDPATCTWQPFEGPRRLCEK